MSSINQNIENQLDNLDLSSSDNRTAALEVDLANDPKPAYEIFKQLEQVILFSDDDEDSEFFTPSIDGKCNTTIKINGNLFVIVCHSNFRLFSSCDCVTICVVLHKDTLAIIASPKHFKNNRTSRYTLVTIHFLPRSSSNISTKQRGDPFQSNSTIVDESIRILSNSRNRQRQKCLDLYESK